MNVSEDPKTDYRVKILVSAVPGLFAPIESQKYPTDEAFHIPQRRVCVIQRLNRC